MASASKIAALIIAVTIAITLFTPIATSVSENSGVQSVANETVTVEVDEWVDLDNYGIVEDSETVEFYDDGTDSWEPLASEDYEMDYDPGEIMIDSASEDVEDGDEIRVSYDYELTDSQATTVLNLIPLMLALLILGVMAARIMDEM